MRRPGGITLVETLVAVGLSGLLLVILSQVMIPGFQIWKQTQAVSELEQNAMVSEQRIKSVLIGTDGDSLQSVNTPSLQAISCLNNEGTLDQSGYDTATGQPLWRSQTIFCLRPQTGVLTQLRWVGPSYPTTDVTALTPAQLTNICNTTNGQRVAHKVRALRITRVPDQPIWNVELNLRADTPRGPLEINRGFAISPRIERVE